MTGFDVAHAALTDAAAAAGAVTERLRSDRRRLDAEVHALLSEGWRGSAADSFRQCWEVWLLGAADVIEGLDSMGSLLVATRHDYELHDGLSQRQLGAVASRIVERLG
jgi:WXG100 family type VII secretion target